MSFPILQFGTSRFLQAHVDLFVSEAIKTGAAQGAIVAVQTTANPDSARRLAAFAAATPYRVEIRGLSGGATVERDVTVDSVRGGVDANTDWPELERLFIAATCIVSNTADRGYETDPADRSEGAPPRSFPAKLARLLIARHRAGAAPVTLFPCELTPDNGATLRRIVLDVMEGWGAPAETLRWAGDECLWVNSLVDRIVSEPLHPLGAVAEPYALWAIEARPGLTPPCVHEQIVVTDDLKRYERLKLFILNLGHTWLAELWRRDRRPETMLVREAMEDSALAAALADLYEAEVLPVFAALGLGAEANAYRDTVLDRFRNPFLKHRLAEIYTNHEAKKQRRFGGLMGLAHEYAPGLKQPRLATALLRD